MIRRILIGLLFAGLTARSAGAAVAADDFFLGVENRGIEIPTSSLLANDEVDPLERWDVVLLSGPAEGELVSVVDGFRYFPKQDASGVDTFTYRLSHGASSSNTATVRLHVSPLWVPLAGDWDGDGDYEPGVYKNDAQAGPFFLLCRNFDREEPDCPAFRPATANVLGFLPVAGNWDADPAEEVGLYNPVTGRFYLFDKVAGSLTLPALTNFKLGAGGKGNLPLAGRWNGQHTASAGLRLAVSGNFGLRDTNTLGGYDHLFFVDGSQPGWIPFTVDLYPGGPSGVGLFDPIAKSAYLRSQLTSGPPEWEVGIYGLGLDGASVPIRAMGDPEGSFSFLSFSRDPYFLVFDLASSNPARPHLKVVIPIDPGQ